MGQVKLENLTPEQLVEKILNEFHWDVYDYVNDVVDVDPTRVQDLSEEEIVEEVMERIKQQYGELPQKVIEEVESALYSYATDAINEAL